MMQYQSLPANTKVQVEEKLKELRGEELCLLLLSMCDLEDWGWVQEVYIQFMDDEDRWVASAAITGIGHFARISKKIDKKRVIKILNKLSVKRPELKGKISDALSDIKVFM